MTEHNAPDISVRPVRMAKSRAEKAKFIEIAPGKHIEASVSMRKLEKRIVRLCAMACTDYGMIEDGDKIAVAMSGGKDSYVLLDALLKLKARAPVHFDIIAVHVNQHIPGSPTHLLEAWLKEKGVTYHIENQDTYSITQKLVPSGKNVCSLCARLRRGILYRVAKELGCTKIALGHQMDDVVSTLLLNMFYGGRIKAMPPVLRSDDGCNTVIRPLIYLREYEMSRWAEICGYPLFPKDLCGVGENLKRKEIKALMTQWDKEFDSRIYNLFMSTTRVAASQLADKTLYDFTHFCRIADCRPRNGRLSSFSWEKIYADHHDPRFCARSRNSDALHTGGRKPLTRTRFFGCSCQCSLTGITLRRSGRSRSGGTQTHLAALACREHSDRDRGFCRRRQ